MASRLRFTVGLLALGLALTTACSEPLPVEAPPPEELREQIHAATGHEPAECTDFRGGAAELAVTETGFSTDCLIIMASSELVVVNEDEVAHTFTIGDPADNLVGRHIRVDVTLEPGDEYVLIPDDAFLGPGVYPFWSKGDQEEGFAGSLIVRT